MQQQLHDGATLASLQAPLMTRGFMHLTGQSAAQCSFHHHAPGFFPGTGAVDDIGEGRGRGFSVNFPLKVRA